MLHVVAADVDKPYLQTTATVTLSVINVPDCPVSFDTTHYFSSGKFFSKIVQVILVSLFV